VDVHGKKLLSIYTRPTAPDRVVFKQLMPYSVSHLTRVTSNYFSIIIIKTVEGVEGK
jgi:hypothetical protein